MQPLCFLLSFSPLTPCSCMPRSSFIGKKREMYEHPVFCLASQVMDLTIREYPAHLEPLHHFRHPSFFSFLVFSFSSTFTNSYSLMPWPAPSCLACSLLAFFFEFVTWILGWVIQPQVFLLLWSDHPVQLSQCDSCSFCFMLILSVCDLNAFLLCFCVSHSSPPLSVYRCVPGLQYWPGTEWTKIIDIISNPGTKQGFWCSFQRHCVSNLFFFVCNPLQQLHCFSVCDLVYCFCLRSNLVSDMFLVYNCKSRGVKYLINCTLLLYRNFFIEVLYLYWGKKCFILWMSKHNSKK